MAFENLEVELLADLDELILTCSDPRSRTYLKESVQCYKAGAYRASVVACWIAVAFDLVDKIRELAAIGDKSAQEQVLRFERIQNNNDISGALSFEKELPEMALKKFEFISHIEYQDLVRLVEDRNRCAHPSQVSDAQVFEASAELARMHIFNSVKSILSQPASQGKSALERIMQDMESRYFPAKASDVYEFLNAGPLKKPKSALYKNFLQILTKTVTSNEQRSLKRSRSVHALLAMKKMHPAHWEKEFPAVVQKIVEAIVDEQDLAQTTMFLAYPKELGTWGYLSDVQRLRIKTFVTNAPESLLRDLDDLLELSDDHPLNIAAKIRIKNASLEELKSVSWSLFVPKEAFLRVLNIYGKSASYAQANEIGKFVRVQLWDVVDAFSYLDILLKIVKNNDQVRHSGELIHVLRALAAGKENGLVFVKKQLIELGLAIEGL